MCVKPIDNNVSSLQASLTELATFGQDREAITHKLNSEKCKVREMEEELEMVKHTFADKQKAMLGEASKNHSKLQEDYEAERAFWKTKLAQASKESMDLRSELYEMSQKHSSELLELRKVARNREEEMDLQTKNLREENRCLEKHISKLSGCVAELEEKLNHAEAKGKELSEEREKCAELQANCEEFAAKEESYKSHIELLKTDTQKEREELKHEIQLERKQREVMLESHRQETSELKVKLEDLEKKKDEEKKEEIQKMTNESCAREEGLVSELEKLKATLKNNAEYVEELENSLKVSREEKEEMGEESQKSKQEWEGKVRDLGERIVELEQEQGGMTELRSTLDEMREERQAIVTHVESVEQENETLEQKLTEEELINRRLATELRSLEAQLSQADRVLREQRQELEKLKNQPDSTVKTFVIERGQRAPEDFRTITEVSEEDTTSESDDSRLRLEDLNASTSSRLSLVRAGSGNQLNRFTSSVTSTSSRASLRNGVQTRAAASRRQSASYLRGKTPPEMRTTSSDAYFIGDQFAKQMEQENEFEYNWDRLSELKRRNASCLPHLQTSYPVEMQLLKPDPTLGEDVVKSGSSTSPGSFSTRKRKADQSFSYAAHVLTRSASARSASEATRSRTVKTLPTSKSDNCITPGKRRKTRRLAEMVQSTFESLRYKSNENLSSNFQAASRENLPPASDDPFESEAERMRALRRGSVCFDVMNAPPSGSGKPSLSRRRTITRSTASTKLLSNEAKAECKKVLEKNAKQDQRGTGKRPLRPRQVKKK